MGKDKKRLPWPLPEMEEVDEEQEQILKDLMDIVEGNKPSSIPPDEKDGEKEDGCEDEEKKKKKAVEEEDDAAEGEADKLPFWYERCDKADRRITCYKFLVARKWKLEDAERMFRDSAAHKIKHRAYLAQFPPAFTVRGYDFDKINEFYGHKDAPRQKGFYDKYWAVIGPHYQAVYHKWDKMCHPIFLERTGKIDAKGLVDAAKSVTPIGGDYVEVNNNFHVHFNEVGGGLVRYVDKNFTNIPDGRRVLGVLAVMDCGGLGYGHMYRPALDMLKKVFGCDAAYYPEGLHRLYLVNAPGMIMFAWSIVKGWLDPRVRQKIVIKYPEDTLETLLEAIDEENLPDFLGGKCSCEGGCCPMPDKLDQHADVDQTLTEIVHIPAGKTTVREFELEEGEEMCWEFEVKTNDIQFEVTFYFGEHAEGASPTKADNGEAIAEADEAGKERDDKVEDEEKKDEGPGSPQFDSASSIDTEDELNRIVVFEKDRVEGVVVDSFKAPRKGVVKLLWDNYYSWVRAKKLTMRLFKM